MNKGMLGFIIKGWLDHQIALNNKAIAENTKKLRRLERDAQVIQEERVKLEGEIYKLEEQLNK